MSDTNNTAEEEPKISDRDLPISFNEERHLEVIEGLNNINQTWRMKDRMKTVSVALVLCLNVGVDPPDVVKTQPCARLECWIDPLTLSPAKALETIGSNLQKQYERWQPRARYKQSLDPTHEEVKKLCTSLRRNAKEERVLFHYNGHGVPKPTTNGEIWVFNRTYTQYIPLSIYDLQSWMGAPSIYVYDCSNAGIIVESFKQFAIQHENEQKTAGQSRGSPVPPSYRNCIQLAACGPNQVLPMNPELPADLFTSCLTTPIKVALRWFLMRSSSKLVPQVKLEMLDKIPGQITDRRTMMGELNWVFTAITDTIAWNTLPRDLFQRLFRQDLLVASLFRNFLLAERILRSHDCTPVSSPELPPTYQHPMWASWDLALDLSLGQLPKVQLYKQPFEALPFFEEQLTAFHVWLTLGAEVRNPPEQLPIVLQVLLSQIHRMRALELLGRFLDLGPWAVNLALSVGIFPYVLKLLQSNAKELRPLLVFIWSKILAVDNTCQSDLVRDNGHQYFLAVLQDPHVSSKTRSEATFVLACIVNNYRSGQEAALQGSLVSLCLEQITDQNPRLRQWVAICLGRLWDHYEKARWTGVRDIAHEKLYSLLTDPIPEVRAAAVYALGTFINSVSERSEHANSIDHSIVMKIVNTISSEMSVLVRKELIASLQWVVLAFEHAFLNVAAQESIIPPMEPTTPVGMRRTGSRDRLRVMSPTASNSGIDQLDSAERLKRVASSSAISTIGHNMIHGHAGSLGTLPGLSYGSVYMKLWAALCILDHDPHPEVAKLCQIVTGHIRNQVKESQRENDRMSTSISLPPSPNRTSYLPESPPTLHPSADLQKLATRSAMAIRTRKLQSNAITEEYEGELRRKPLLKTNFVPWSCKKFAQTSFKSSPLSDKESREHFEREWRYIRNNGIRKESTEEQRRATASRLETQVFNTRTAAPPSILQFHPYDQRLVVAGRDSYGIWDWGTGAKLTYCQVKSSKFSTNKITSIQWVNGFDVSLLMIGSDDGTVRIYNPNGGTQGNRDPSLVSAWQAHNELNASTTKPTYHVTSGLLLTWEQWTQTVISTGDTRVLRFWDAARELKSYDIPTGADCSITCLDSSFSSVAHEQYSLQSTKFESEEDGLTFMSNAGSKEKKRFGLVVVGCANGTVRVYDRRCSPNDARVKLWMDHTSPVLSVMLRENMIISGCGADGVRIYDMRSTKVLHSNIANTNLTSIAMHRSADVYACSTAQNISLYNYSGQCLNNLRFYEGFMGYRIGPVISMVYHPHRVALAAGTQDCTISVYCLENRR